MKPAARIGDMHTCPAATPGTPPIPHVGGPILTGAATVQIGGMPAARMGDTAICVGPPDTVAAGEPTVLIEGKPAARMGDPMAHGGTIATGCPTVLIGPGVSGGGGAAGGGAASGAATTSGGSSGGSGGDGAAGTSNQPGDNADASKGAASGAGDIGGAVHSRNRSGSGGDSASPGAQRDRARTREETVKVYRCPARGFSAIYYLHKKAKKVRKGMTKSLRKSPYPAIGLLIWPDNGLKEATLKRKISRLVKVLGSKHALWNNAELWSGPRRLHITVYVAWKGDSIVKNGSEDLKAYRKRVGAVVKAMKAVNKVTKKLATKEKPAIEIDWALVPVLEARSTDNDSGMVKKFGTICKRKSMSIERVSVRWSGAVSRDWIDNPPPGVGEFPTLEVHSFKKKDLKNKKLAILSGDGDFVIFAAEQAAESGSDFNFGKWAQYFTVANLGCPDFHKNLKNHSTTVSEVLGDILQPQLDAANNLPDEITVARQNAGFFLWRPEWQGRHEAKDGNNIFNNDGSQSFNNPKCQKCDALSASNRRYVVRHQEEIDLIMSYRTSFDGDNPIPDGFTHLGAADPPDLHS